MTRVNTGVDMQSAELGGGNVGFGGTATGSSSTTLTMTGAGWTVNAYAGQMVAAGSVYGIILSNTATVLTIDRWYNPATPGGTVGSIPSTTALFSILPGAAPAMFMGITTDSAAANLTDTTLPSEVVAAGSGCLRKMATYAHTTGVGSTSYTMTSTYTYNSTDATFGSRTLAKIGLFNSLLIGGIMQFETLMNASATLVILGDAVTVTQTVSE
jgi:hypothetical protein